jgi:hypothetical protein
MLANIPKEIVVGQKMATPLENRVETVEEVADVVAWLAREESGGSRGRRLVLVRARLCVDFYMEKMEWSENHRFIQTI